MAALAKDNPLKPVHDKVERLRAVLEHFLKNVLKKFAGTLKSLAQFIKKAKASAKEIADKVGKSAVKGLIAAADQAIETMRSVEHLVASGLALAQKIVAMIRKAADPQKVMKAVKSLVARLAKAFRTLATSIVQFYAAIDPVHSVLKMIDTFVVVLRLMISWITDVTGVASGVKKLKDVMKKAVREVKSELRTVTDMVKDANALKPA